MERICPCIAYQYRCGVFLAIKHQHDICCCSTLEAVVGYRYFQRVRSFSLNVATCKTKVLTQTGTKRRVHVSGVSVTVPIGCGYGNRIDGFAYFIALQCIGQHRTSGCRFLNGEGCGSRTVFKQGNIIRTLYFYSRDANCVITCSNIRRNCQCHSRKCFYICSPTHQQPHACSGCNVAYNARRHGAGFHRPARGQTHRIIHTSSLN